MKNSVAAAQAHASDPLPSEWIDGLVCGLPRLERDGALIAMLSHSFADESGGEPASTFVVAGYLGTVEMWKGFADDWQRELDRAPKLPPIHTVDCALRRKNGFEVVKSDADMEARLLRLVSVLAKHKPDGFVVYLNSGYARLAAKHIMPSHRSTQRLAYPYAFSTLIWLDMVVRAVRSRRRQFGRLMAIFDHHQQFALPVKRVITEELVPEWREENRDLGSILEDCYWPPSPAPAKYLPLQAADLLAWHWRRSRDHVDGKNRAVFKALRKATRIKSFHANDDRVLSGLISGYKPEARQRVIQRVLRDLGSSAERS